MSEFIERGGKGFLKDYCEFGENRVYILMAIARKTHNGSVSGNNEPVYREVIHNEAELEHAYQNLLGRLFTRPYTWRVYLTVNARDPMKAYWTFRQRMDGWVKDLLHGDDAAQDKFGKIDQYWMSDLHSNVAKADSRFVFDLDTTDHGDYLSFVESLPAQDGSPVDNPDESVFIRKRQTPNGYHVITEPFNHTVFDPPVEYDELDTDGMVHVAEVSE